MRTWASSMREHTSSITSKGQVTIPADIRRLLGVAPHDKIAFVIDADQVRIAPATSVVARTAGILGSDHPKGTPAEEAVAAELAMAEEAAR